MLNKYRFLCRAAHVSGRWAAAVTHKSTLRIAESGMLVQNNLEQSERERRPFSKILSCV